MSNTLVIDTESNTWNKGAPYDRRFKNVCYSWADASGAGAERTSTDSIERLRQRIERAGTIVGFNLKYDLNVLRKIGITIPDTKRLWDCQLAEFILSNQTNRYPSLEDSCNSYGLPLKNGEKIKEYWTSGIQTEDIPWEELHEYAVNDAEITFQLYLHQQKIMSENKKNLCRLQCMDLSVLAEMEWNGLKYNEDLCEQRSIEIEAEIRGIEKELSGIYPDVPINFASGDHLSAFLYGGSIKQEVKEHIGFFKTGARIGEPKYKNIEVVHELPRLVEPLKGSELKKDGYFATNADTLLKLRAGKRTKHIIEAIQRASRLQSLLSKSYRGIVKSNREGNWEPGWLHGQFNQCVATTGRLSSSSPNLQNIDNEALDLFVSRYDE